MVCTHALLPQGWRTDVRLEWVDGRFTRITPDAAAIAGEPRVAVALPGMADLHSHAFQRGMAGRAERAGPAGDTFWSWREAMYRFALAVTPDDVEAIAGLLYAELLEAGFTRVGEFHYLHHDRDGGRYAAIDEMAQRIAAAAAQTGIGLTLLPSLYQQAGFAAMPAHDGQRRFVCTTDAFARLLELSGAVVRGLPGAVLGVAPHSLRAVAPEALAAGVALAGDGPIHIHVAEQRREVADCLAWSGARPVAWLLDHAPVDARWCLIHATHTTPAELAGIAAREATAGLCPITEASLGDGIFAATEFVAGGGRFGIGTDSNISIGLADELRQLEYTQRLRDGTRNALAPPGRSTGRALFDAACAGGARALGAGPGGLAVGAWADVVSLDAAHPLLAALHGDALLDAWLFAAGNAAIDDVWARGQHVVAGGRHVARADLRRRYAAAMVRLAA